MRGQLKKRSHFDSIQYRLNSSLAAVLGIEQALQLRALGHEELGHANRRGAHAATATTTAPAAAAPTGLLGRRPPPA